MGDTAIIVLVILLVSLGFTVPAFVAIRFYRRVEAKAGEELERIWSRYAGLGIPTDNPCCVFHTYHGYLLWVTQTTHRVPIVESESVRSILDELRRFNRRWGMFAYGMGVIPVLSWWEYRKALKRVHMATSSGLRVLTGTRG